MVRFRDNTEDPARQIHRKKHGRMAEEHLGAAEQEKTVGIERKRKPAENSRLRVGVEVHQRIATEQQIETAEHDGTPEFAIERRHGAVTGKVFFPKSWWQLFEIARAVDRATGF